MNKPDGTYETILCLSRLRELVGECMDHGHFCIDVETTSTNASTCQLVGISISPKMGYGAYIPLFHTDESEGQQDFFSVEQTLVQRQLPFKEVQPLIACLCSSDLVKYFFNAVYDMTVLKRYGMPVSDPLYDMMSLVHAIENGKWYMNTPGIRNYKGYGFSMAEIAKRALDIDMIPIKSLLGSGKKAVTFDRVPIEAATEYAAADVDIPFRIANQYQPNEQVQRKLYQMDFPLCHALTDIGTTGIKLDMDYLGEMAPAVQTKQKMLQDEIYEIAGRKILLTSYQQLSNWLFGDLGLDPGPENSKGKSGYWSTRGPALVAIADSHPVIPKLIEYKELSHMNRYYLHPLMTMQQNGRIYTGLNPFTSTDRLSSYGPNLQNIPTYEVLGYHIRRAFIPSDGMVWSKADYSQVELRVLAHILKAVFNDSSMIEIFEQGGDIHCSTAANVLHIDPDTVTESQRRIAKAVNFGLIYGQGAGGLAYGLKISYREAQNFLNGYFLTYPGVPVWMEWQREFGRNHGYVETPFFQFRRYLPTTAANEMLNTPVQGGAAEIIRMAMATVNQRMKTLPGNLLLQVHDELDLEIPKDAVPEVTEMLRYEMESAMPTMFGPLKVDIEIGPNWKDVVKYENGRVSR